jgi:hypothetical protein
VVSFNLVFHLASALTSIALIYALLRLQSQLRFQRRLWQSLNPIQAKVVLDWPQVFLNKYAEALGLVVSGEIPKLPPSKIHVEILVRAHFELGLTKITWQDHNAVSLKIRSQQFDQNWPEKFAKALGGSIQVRLES